MIGELPYIIFNQINTFELPLFELGSTNGAIDKVLNPGDVKISIDQGTAINIETLPVVIAGTNRYLFELSAEESVGEEITIIVEDVAFTTAPDFAPDTFSLYTVNDIDARYPVVAFVRLSHGLFLKPCL